MAIDRWLWGGCLKVNESGCGLALGARCHSSLEGLCFLSLFFALFFSFSCLFLSFFLFLFLSFFFFLSFVHFFFFILFLSFPSPFVLPPSPPTLLTLPSSMQTRLHACLLACLPGVLKAQKSAFLYIDDRCF